MLEQYYSKLQPRLRAKELSGRLEEIARIEGDQSEDSDDTFSEHRGGFDADSKSAWDIAPVSNTYVIKSQ